MTMALRVPTLRNSCGPRSTGSRTAVTSSPGASTVRFTPVTNSSTGTDRAPAGPRISTTASSAASTGSVSPAGDAVPRLPPIVPALRIWGEPTVRAAWPRAGTSAASSPCSISV